MRLGDRGIEVKELQEFLIGIGLLNEMEHNYGPRTKEAVMKLQESLGYNQTGVWEESLALLYSLEMSQKIAKRSSSGGLKYKIGDIVEIVGDGAYYGGLGDGAGISVPSFQKGGKAHTIMDVSESRVEYLLQEIYSWVPEEFLQLITSAPEESVEQEVESEVPGVVETPSDVQSTVVVEPTPTEDKKNPNYVPYRVDTLDCYVQNLNTGKTTKFEISPETVSDAVVANFEDQATKSRTSPFKAYANSGPREISFTIELFDDYCELGILKTVRRFQALTVPTKSGGYVHEPRCKVKIGKFIDIIGVCTSVSVEWAKPYKDEVYSKADVSFSFNEVEEVSKFADEWEA